MVQYRALVIALILLLSTTLPEVHSRSISGNDRRDWMVVPDAIAAYVYEAVNKVSPSAAQFLLDVSQIPMISGIRSLLIRGTSRLSILAEQLIEKLRSMWNMRIVGY